jgi:hypothetical protein
MEENPELAECRVEKDSAFETLNKDQAEYDKQLLALSAAFLGVGLAFVKDVVPLKDATHLWVFNSALGVLLGCVCLVLGTFQYSIHGHFRLVEYWDKKKELLEAPAEKKDVLTTELTSCWRWLDRKAKRIKAANLASGLLFVVGTIFLIVFVGINIHHEAHLAEQPVASSVKQTAQTTPCAAPLPLPSTSTTGAGVNLTQQNSPQTDGGHK